MAKYKKKLDFLTKVVIFVFAFLTVFTIVCFISNHTNGLPQDTLIQWVFTVFGLELLVTMFKKYIDKKYGKDDLNGFDTDYECNNCIGFRSDNVLSDSVDQGENDC